MPTLDFIRRSVYAVVCFFFLIKAGVKLPYVKANSVGRDSPYMHTHMHM